MKIFLYPPGENWIVDRITNEFLNTTKHKFTNIHVCDSIVLFAPWCWNQYKEDLLENKNFIVMIHHIVPDKFNLEDFKLRDKFVDQYIVPNKYTKKFIKKHTKKPIKQICYWINQKIWNDIDKDTAREFIINACKANKDKIVTNIDLDKNIKEKFFIGTFQRDTEGSDLKSPKLEKGPDLFIESILNLKKDISDVIVLLGGWRRQYIINELHKHKIDYIYIESPSLDIVNIMYDMLDMYIVSSRHEGGPQAIIECAYKKVPIISTNVGIASNILHDDCILEVNSNYIIPNKDHVEFAYKNVLKITIDKQVKKIDNIIDFWGIKK